MATRWQLNACGARGFVASYLILNRSLLARTKNKIKTNERAGMAGNPIASENFWF